MDLNIEVARILGHSVPGQRFPGTIYSREPFGSRTTASGNIGVLHDSAPRLP